MSDQELDEIEERLAAMRPAEPDPAVSQRIAESLESGSSQGERPLIFRIPTVLVLAVAACLALALVLLPFIGQVPLTPPIADDRDTPAPVQDEPIQPSGAAEEDDRIAPTFLVLHQALRESPSDLDRLLDEISEQRVARLSAEAPYTQGAAYARGAPLPEDLP